MRQFKAFAETGGTLRRRYPETLTNMRVALAQVADKVDIWLRFGRPLCELRLDRWRRLATFAPGSICCTVRWFGIDCGGPHWQLLVLRAPLPEEAATLIEGVAPRTQVLLQALGEDCVQRLLATIDGMEQAGVDPCALPVADWMRLARQIGGNQLASAPASPSPAGSPRRGRTP